jgi:quercetin 2,3-dioxygenase
MMQIRRSEERGYADHGWLRSYHTFSFADYHDAGFMGFGPLRVINEDRVAGGQGFGTHGHADMEILSYVLEGELAHRDSLGNGSVIRPGDVQRMSAGNGIRHSEFNALEHQVTHFLQIWIIPARRGLEPGYEQRHFPVEERRGRLRILASPDGDGDSVIVHQDARVYGVYLDGDETAALPLADGRLAWVQVARGSARVNGETLAAGDGAALAAEGNVQFSHGRDAELLLFDLPP